MTPSECKKSNDASEAACVSCWGWLDRSFLETAKKYSAALCCADVSTENQYLQGRRWEKATAGEYFSGRSTSGLKPYDRTLFTPFPIMMDTDTVPVQIAFRFIELRREGNGFRIWMPSQ